MPDFNELSDQLNVDSLRKRSVAAVHAKTGRNVIIYYSGWLQKQGQVPQKVVITDADMNGFMAAICGLDKTKGLDLILHTPGGEVNATEALVAYLRSIFGTDIRAFVPQMAMSAGTMIALSCKEIWMGKHSSIGPIDPQIGGVAAHGIVEEWDKAQSEIKANPVLANAWNPILQKYGATLLGQCQKAIQMADAIVKKWLPEGALHHIADAAVQTETIKKVMESLGEHKKTLNHGRHVSATAAEAMGLNIKWLESEQSLQDAILTVHHSLTLTFTNTPAMKVIENHLGKGMLFG
jgi:ClpP class serine protease